MPIRISFPSPPGGTTQPIPSSNRASGSGRIPGAVICLVFIAAGVAASWFAAVRPALRAREAASAWRRVPCTVMASRVVEHIGSAKHGPTYSPDVRYQYIVDARQHVSSQFSFSPGGSSDRDEAQAIIERYPRGSRHTCYVNPANPADAVLEPNLGSRAWMLGFPAIFVVVGLVGLVLTLRGRRGPSLVPASTASAGVANAGGGDMVTLKLSARPLTQFISLLALSIVFDGILAVFVWQLVAGHVHSVVFAGIWMLLWGVGCVLLTGSAARAALALFNPRATVTLSRGAIPPGGSAELRWTFEGRYDRITKLTIQLEGRERATYRRGTNTSTDTRVFVTIPLFETERSDQMERGKCTLRLPAEAMHTFRAANNKVLWFVVLKGEIPRWPDVKEEFEIEVPPPPLASMALASDVRSGAEAGIVSDRPDAPLRIRTADNRTSFSPGEAIAGTVSWSLPAPPKEIDVRLFWFTRGKGTVDLGVVDTVAIDDPAVQGQRTFSLRVPNGPYSASGSLVSVVWAIEAIAEPKGGSERTEIVCAPGGLERVMDAAMLPLPALASAAVGR